MRPLLAGLLLLAACSSETEEPLTGVDASVIEPDGGDASVGEDAGAQNDASIHPPRDLKFCLNMRGPAPSSGAPAIGLSVAHAEIRFFAAVEDYATVDRAFADALAPEDALDDGLEDTLYRFVDPLSAACVVPTDDTPLGPASVRMLEDVAIVRPGLGALEIPDEAGLIALDLRDLPAAPELHDALLRATDAILHESLISSETVRRHLGMRDEVISVNNVYDLQIIERPIVYPGSAARERRVVVFTAEQMAPESMRLAMLLREGQRAHLIGSAVSARVAESDMRAVGSYALAYRTRLLPTANGYAAEIETSQHELALADYDREQPILYPQSNDDSRSVIAVPAAVTDPWPLNLSRGYARASLLSLHGAMRLFFPYFHVVGDRIDERLLEVLARLDGEAVAGSILNAMLRSFIDVLEDGHSFIYDFHNAREHTTYFPLRLDQLGGEVVVRASHGELIPRGSKLLRFNGLDANNHITERLHLVSASTPGHRWALAADLLNAHAGPITYEYERPDGTLDAVTVTGTRTPMRELYAVSDRKTGTLADLGHPDVLFVNMDQTDGGMLLAQTLTATTTFNAMVIDMRGYPAFNFAEVLQRIISTTVNSSWFRIPLYEGPGTPTIYETRWAANPAFSRRFDGPAVLLVSHRSVSAAETFSSILVQNNRVTVVGRNSAGTNGNITGIQLPSGFGVTFTGMEVENEDRTTFHGVGIIPDVVVEPTRADLAAGRDVELEAALDVLGF